MENNRRKYNIAMLVMTLAYVALVAIFIAGAYVITDGMGFRWSNLHCYFLRAFLCDTLVCRPFD